MYKSETAQSPSCDRSGPDRSAGSGRPQRGGDNVQLLTNICLLNSFVGSHLSSWHVVMEYSIRRKWKLHFYSSDLIRVNSTPNLDDVVVSVFAF